MIPIFSRLLILLLMWAVYSAHAVPMLDLQSQDRVQLNTDLRSIWETTRVPGQALDTSVPLDAQAVWDMPQDRFAPGQAVPVSLKNGERLVSRVAMQLQDSPVSLVVEIAMPRLDVIHLTYRYNGGAWVQASSGDQIPMVKWPFANRYPVFVIPPKPGRLDMVVDIPQQGLFPSPVRLLGDPFFRESHNYRNMEAGAAMVLAFVCMVVCFGGAIVFKRFVFVAVGFYSISVLLLTAGQGGILGMYAGTESTWFNDYSKYVAGMIFGAMVPWTVSVVLAQKYYSRFFGGLALWWMIGGLVITAAMLFAVPRAVQWAILSPFLIASLIFALSMSVAAVVRSQSHALWTLAALVLLCAGIFAPIAAYWGYLDGQWSFSLTAFSFLMSSPLLMLALLMQYRHGNRVMVRASATDKRDALTGLLNRSGFVHKLAKTVKNALANRSQGLFMYVAVSDAETLQERFGGEGFESGMVQIAAALSSSISVMDTVARVAPNAFGVTVMMTRDHKQASDIAQKIITRTMAIATHSTPMAQTTRIALAWIPDNGTELDLLEKYAKSALRKLEQGKRIGWVNANALSDSQMQSDSPDSAGLDKVDIHGLINRLEKEFHIEESNPSELQRNRKMRVADSHLGDASA
jgi:GGDEF domain-containing protein